MLSEALQAEVDASIAQFAGERDDHGRRLVVRNGSHQPREVLTSAGAVEVTAPRVNDRRTDPDTGQRRRFSSAILPPWCRKTPKVTEVLPLLYLHGLCLLVLIGVRADGRKELVALADGYCESVESWADLLRDCARRGMSAPVLAVGDGALGFWGALREVFPATREQRNWFHKIANVLGALPKSAHPGAKKALAEIWNAEDRRHALDAVTSFKAAYGTKFGKAVAKITDDLEQLLAFYDFPAEHWIRLRTTNPIESTFATVRHRTKITRGPGSRAAGLAMAFKLIQAAQDRWRAVNAPHLVALVRAGATFEAGKLVERPNQQPQPKAA